MFAVIYSSAGCLPDNDEPEFVGTVSECFEYIEAHVEDYAREGVEHDLYELEVVPLES